MKLTLKGEVIKTEVDKHYYKEDYTGQDSLRRGTTQRN